jgi:hypothetical protein
MEGKMKTEVIGKERWKTEGGKQGEETKEKNWKYMREDRK